MTAPERGDASYDPARRPASPLTKAQARRLTDKIATAVENLWALLSEARDANAWAALGYASWTQYVSTEFGMSRGQSYRLLDQARMIGELEEAAGVGPGGLGAAVPSARAAADVKPILPEVVEEVREVAATVPPAERPAAVAEIVKDARRRTPPILPPVTPRQPPGGPPTDAQAPDTPGPSSTARSAPWSLAELTLLLLARKPAEARDLTADQFARLQSWVQQAGAVREPASATNRQPAPQPRRDVTPRFK